MAKQFPLVYVNSNPAAAAAAAAAAYLYRFTRSSKKFQWETESLLAVQSAAARPMQ